MVMGSIEDSAEVVIIGAGPGGYAAAVRAAQLGKEVVLVEKEKLGGTCLQHGCIPSKAIIHAADMMYEVKQATKMGILVEKAAVSLPQLQQWKRGVVETLTKEMEATCKSLGISVMRGTASFESPTSVVVQTESGERRIEFEHAVIATGSMALVLDIAPLDGSFVISSYEALNAEKVPTKLVVVGGGYIGLELGMAYAKLGSTVTILETTDKLLGTVDQELVRVLEKRMEAIGIRVVKNITVQSVNAQKKAVMARTAAGQQVGFDADQVLVCVGRAINCADLQLGKANVALHQNGTLKVDQQLRTNNPRVYAVGDVTGVPMLAHRAVRQGKVAAECIAGMKSAFDNVAVPAVMFTDPEIATAGLTEEEAKRAGYYVAVGRSYFKASGRAMVLNNPNGFVKLVADAKTRQVLGIHMIGENASDVISEAVLALEMGALVDDLALTIHPHPTMPEAVMEAAENVMREMDMGRKPIASNWNDVLYGEKKLKGILTKEDAIRLRKEFKEMNSQK